MVHVLQEIVAYKGQLLHASQWSTSSGRNGGFKGQSGQANIVNKEEAVQEKSVPNSEEFKDFNREEVERLRNLL